MNAIKQYSYYIIRIDNSKLHKSYFKIGETDNSKRPDNLCKEYEQKSANKAYKILQDKLPVSGHKRLNDKRIHAELEKNGIIRTNPYEFEVEVSSDGKAEIFEFNGMTDADVIEYVKNTVSELTKDKSNYTAGVKTKTYDNEAYNKHMVNANLIKEIEKITGRIAGKKINNNILLIGQFDHEWKIMCCATNNIYIMHDSPDNKKPHDYTPINEKITYINDIQEIIEKNMKFDIIIANPPYGRPGAEITKFIIDNVEFDEYVNLMPLKDYTIETGKYIDFNSAKVCPPKSFNDADILTHIVKIQKRQNNITNDKELICASFVFDKPFAKFMNANMLKHHYAIDNISLFKNSLDVNKTFVYSPLTIRSQHTCGFESISSDTVSNNFNFNNIIKNSIFKKSGGSGYKAISFNTEQEKHNFVEFYKANRNFINRMIANQFIGIRNDSACFPKVDWQKSDWTIEKILKETADYTNEEIQLVLDTMDKDYTVKNNEDIKKLFFN